MTTISDLQGKSQDLTLYGSPECRQRIDCLLGLEQYYGLKFKQFVPVDIGLRYEVLDKGAGGPVDPLHDRRQLANATSTRCSRTTSTCCPRGT